MRLIESFCKWVADLTAAPLALIGCIIFQILWIVVGTATGKDAYPFPFLLTISNIVQLVLIFVIAVAQRQQHDVHAERHNELLGHLRIKAIDDGDGVVIRTCIREQPHDGPCNGFPCKYAQEQYGLNELGNPREGAGSGGSSDGDGRSGPRP